MMDIKEDLLLWFINFLIKSQKEVVLIYHQSLMNNQLKNYTNQLLENLKKEKAIPDLKIIYGELIYLIFQLISKFNKGFRFLLCVFDILSKCAWVAPLKGKKGVTIVDAFQKILDK